MTRGSARIESTDDAPATLLHSPPTTRPADGPEMETADLAVDRFLAVGTARFVAQHASTGEARAHLTRDLRRTAPRRARAPLVAQKCKQPTSSRPLRKSGRRDLNPRPPEPHSGQEPGQIRQIVALTRCSGHRCRILEPPSGHEVVRNSQQNSQHPRSSTHPALLQRKGSRHVPRVRSGLKPNRDICGQPKGLCLLIRTTRELEADDAFLRTRANIHEPAFF